MADFGGMRATRVQMASGGRVDRAWRIARQQTPLTAFGGRWHRNRREQRLGIGMLRAPENLLRRRRLDNPPEIHDRHPRRDMLDDGEIVTDEHISQPEFLLQVGQQIENLRADRNIER